VSVYKHKNQAKGTAKMLKRIMVLVVLVLALAAASPAYACACSASGPEGAQMFVDYFNSLPYEVRSTANTLPPYQYGYTWDENYYMVPLY
jgi:hypothetical protein